MEVFRPQAAIGGLASCCCLTWRAEEQHQSSACGTPKRKLGTSLPSIPELFSSLRPSEKWIDWTGPQVTGCVDPMQSSTGP
jgi:hypothetical protein